IKRERRSDLSGKRFELLASLLLCGAFFLRGVGYTPLRNMRIRCDAVLIFTGQVCTKTVDFLFVKTRRVLRTRHEDFCAGQQKRYVVFGESDTAVSEEWLQV